MITEMRELIGPTDVEPVVYIGHPRDGILGYFDQFNDPYGDNQGGYNLLTSLSGNCTRASQPCTRTNQLLYRCRCARNLEWKTL